MCVGVCVCMVAPRMLAAGPTADSNDTAPAIMSSTGGVQLSHADAAAGAKSPATVGMKSSRGPAVDNDVAGLKSARRPLPLTPPQLVSCPSASPTSTVSLLLSVCLLEVSGPAYVCLCAVNHCYPAPLA